EREIRFPQPVPQIVPPRPGDAGSDASTSREQAAGKPADSAARAGLTREADLSAVRTIPVATRPNKVDAGEFAHPPGDDRSFKAFIASLPDVLAARDFDAVVDAIAGAARRKRGVVAMLGGHIVKTGISPLLIDLMRRRVITHLAMNGSAAIHDYEV